MDKEIVFWVCRLLLTLSHACCSSSYAWWGYAGQNVLKACLTWFQAGCDMVPFWAGSISHEQLGPILDRDSLQLTRKVLALAVVPVSLWLLFLAFTLHLFFSMWRLKERLLSKVTPDTLVAHCDQGGFQNWRPLIVIWLHVFTGGRHTLVTVLLVRCLLCQGIGTCLPLLCHLISCQTGVFCGHHTSYHPFLISISVLFFSWQFVRKTKHKNITFLWMNRIIWSVICPVQLSSTGGMQVVIWSVPVLQVCDLCCELVSFMKRSQTNYPTNWNPVQVQCKYHLFMNDSQSNGTTIQYTNSKAISVLSVQTVTVWVDKRTTQGNYKIKLRPWWTRRLEDKVLTPKFPKFLQSSTFLTQLF